MIRDKLNQREAFNNLFDTGKSFHDYRTSVDREGVRKKLDAHLLACDDCIDEYNGALSMANLPLKILAISTSWCGDCANTLPILYKLAERNDKWEFKIASRDENSEIVNNFYLTAGRMKVPVVIFADNDGDEIVRWIERPNRSYKLVRELKNKKLNKEDYISEYKAMPELQAPDLTREITRELIEAASKAANMIDILPSRKD